MSSVEKLALQNREGQGSSESRKLRKEGMVPGVIYGGKHGPRAISISQKVLAQEIKKPGFLSRVYAVEGISDTKKVIAKDIQFHPVTDQPIHIDFMRVDAGSMIHVQIPVHFINEDKSPGIKMGGILNVIVHNLEVICAANHIPEALTIDLTGMNIHQSVHLDHVALPEGVKAAHPERDNTLMTIVAPSVLNVEESSEAAGAEQAENAKEEE